MRFSKSTSRGLTKTGCVCESTNPGRTTLPAQSISITFLRFFFSQGSRRASLVLPTETILPPRHKTAPSSILPSSLRSAARRGPGLPEEDRRVRSWPILARSIADSLCTRAPERRRARLRHEAAKDSCSHIFHFSDIGTLTPALFANSFASSYP